jgi:hypothetical protein
VLSLFVFFLLATIFIGGGWGIFISFAFSIPLLLILGLLYYSQADVFELFQTQIEQLLENRIDYTIDCVFVLGSAGLLAYGLIPGE